MVWSCLDSNGAENNTKEALNSRTSINRNGFQFEIREGPSQGLGAAMSFENRGEDVAIVGGDGEIARALQDSFGQTRPAAIDFPTENAAAQDEHDTAAAMIGAEGRILFNA